MFHSSIQRFKQIAFSLGLLLALFSSVAPGAQGQPLGYSGRKLAIKADFQSFYYRPMFGGQVEFMVSRGLGLALSHNRRSFESELKMGAESPFINSPSGNGQFDVSNTSVFLRIYKGNEALGSQIGGYDVIQFGVNRLNAEVPLSPVVTTPQGDFVQNNPNASERFRASGLVLGYGKGHQFLFAKRFLLDVGATAYGASDKSLSNTDDPQTSELAFKVTQVIYGRRTTFYDKGDDPKEPRVTLGLRLSARIGFLL